MTTQSCLTQAGTSLRGYAGVQQCPKLSCDTGAVQALRKRMPPRRSAVLARRADRKSARPERIMNQKKGSTPGRAITVVSR